MRANHRRALLGVAIVACTFPLMGLSCAVTQGFSNSGLPKIQFEGDSITVGSAADINAHYGTSYDVAVDGYTGGTAYERMSSIANDAANHPQVAVINLGTNDAAAVITGRTLTINGVTGPWDPVEPIADVNARLDTIAADFAGACVVFVTIDTQDADWYGSNATQAVANAETINDHIRSIRGIQVADWDAALQPSDFDTPGQPHPNETGLQHLMQVEDLAISGCPSTTPSTDTTTSTAPSS